MSGDVVTKGGGYNPRRFPIEAKMLGSNVSILDVPEVKEDKRPVIHFDLNGKVTLPEDYHWCSRCDFITPWMPPIEGSILRKDWLCGVCGETVPYGDVCPECWWPVPEEDIGFSHDLTFHYPHCKSNPSHPINQNRWDSDNTEGHRIIRVTHNNQFESDDCGCPKVRVFSRPYYFDYKSWSYPSMDCSNAVGWSYKVKCQICGTIFDCEDTNC